MLLKNIHWCIWDWYGNSLHNSYCRSNEKIRKLHYHPFPMWIIFNVKRSIDHHSLQLHLLRADVRTLLQDKISLSLALSLSLSYIYSHSVHTIVFSKFIQSYFCVALVGFLIKCSIIRTPGMLQSLSDKFHQIAALKLFCLWKN